MLRRCWGTCASPASPWPPSSHPCTRRPSPQSPGPASSQTTAARTLRPPSLLGGTVGRRAGSLPPPSAPENHSLSPLLLALLLAPGVPPFSSTPPCPQGIPSLPLSFFQSPHLLPVPGRTPCPLPLASLPGAPLPTGLTFLRTAAPRAGLQPPAPIHALLLLQPLLLRVGLIPVSLLHQPLVGPQAAVGGRHALLVLVEGQGQLREVVHVLRVVPAGPHGVSCRDTLGPLSASPPACAPPEPPKPGLVSTSPFPPCTLQPPPTCMFCHIILLWELAPLVQFFIYISLKCFIMSSLLFL